MKREINRLHRIRRELDEAAEWIERLAIDLEAQASGNGVPKLVGAKEIAELLGTSRSNVSVWSVRGQLPAPVAELACGRVWLERDIKAWARKRERAS